MQMRVNPSLLSTRIPQNDRDFAIVERLGISFIRTHCHDRNTAFFEGHRKAIQKRSGTSHDSLSLKLFGLRISRKGFIRRVAHCCASRPSKSRGQPAADVRLCPEKSWIQRD